jgi:hypothetical protein
LNVNGVVKTFKYTKMKKIVSIVALFFTVINLNAYMHSRIYVVPAYGANCTGQIIIETCGMGSNSYTLTVNGMPYTIGDPFLSSLCGTTYTVDFSSTDGITPYQFTATVSLAGNSAAVNYTTQPTVQPLTTIVTYMASSMSCDGQISLNITGGHSPINHAWYQNGSLMAGNTTNPLTNLCPGSYGFTVTDNSPYVCGTGMGMPFIPITIESVACTINPTNVTCFGFCNGQAEITALGNPMNYQMAMVAGPDNNMYPNITVNQCAGNVFGNVQHVTGTMAFCVSVITEPTQLALDVTVMQPSTTGANGTATATVTGGTPAYSYNWNGTPVSNNTFSIGAGTHVVTVIDANGCQINTSYDVYNPLMITVGSIQHQTNATPNGQMNEVISGGVPPYTTYLNISSTLVPSDYTGLAAGNYDAVVMDAENNQASVEFTIGNALSIAESNTTLLTVYPNPASDIITITTNSTNLIEIRIMDLQGRLIDAMPMTASSSTLTYNVSNLTNGYYFIELIDSNNTLSRATLIKK